MFVHNNNNNNNNVYKISLRLSLELIFVAFVRGKTNQSLLIRELNSQTYTLNLVHITTP